MSIIIQALNIMKKLFTLLLVFAIGMIVNASVIAADETAQWPPGVCVVYST